jgi:hypothetical protein
MYRPLSTTDATVLKLWELWEERLWLLPSASTKTSMITP